MSFDEPRRGLPIARIVLWSLAGLVIAAGASLLFWPRAIEPPTAPPPSADAGEAAAVRNVTLYFGDRDGKGLVTERRDVPASSALETSVEAVIQALAAGPEVEGSVRTLPDGARLRRAFHDSESATIYLDFDPALVTRHPGGSAAEYATVAALVRTLGANFPQIVRVQILVDGQPVETLAGHFDTSRPLEIATWE
jgi:spore germination protein GerM